MYSLMMTANGVSPPIIMRTAATPMPTPKSSLGPESVLEEGVAPYGEAGPGFGDAGSIHAGSRRGSSASMGPLAYDQHSLVRNGPLQLLLSELVSHASPPPPPRHAYSLFLSLQGLSSPGRRSPLPPRSWGSRRSSWNSLGRAPSLKRRDTSGERESLLSGEGGEEGDGQEGAGEAGGNNRPRPESLELLQASTLCPSVPAEHGDCNGRTATYDPNVNSADPKDDSSPEDDMDDDVRHRGFFTVRSLSQRVGGGNCSLTGGGKATYESLRLNMCVRVRVRVLVDVLCCETVDGFHRVKASKSSENKRPLPEGGA